MAISVSKSALKPKLLDYLRKVERDKQYIVVTDRNRPVARIVPYTDDGRDIFKELKGSVLSYDSPLDPVGEDDWESNT